MSSSDVKLIAHLLRRAGFGASKPELDAYTAKGYEATVDELVDFDEPNTMSPQLIRRYHNEQSAMMGQNSMGSFWLYRMISTTAPLQEKVTLLWHNVFATGYAGKVVQGKVISDQFRMLRRYGLGSFKTLLVELSRDPAMIAWLDNNDNHNGSINENFGRELLELFSMGVGNYTEDDVKEASRAFTGWTIANNDYMRLRAQRDSIWPYGRIAWHFEYHPQDHDDAEKEFLGESGTFNGEDIVDVICRQPATARFIARHMYNFFVADEPPVPSWPYKPPRDPGAIDTLMQAYFDSDYDIRSMLWVLFTSDFFMSESTWYEKVKSPAESVAGVLRLTGEFERPRRQILQRQFQMNYMGQHLGNPPSVEGWHTGTEWIDSGTLTERLNFASEQLGDKEKPGVKAMIDRIVGTNGDAASPEGLVDECLDQLGAFAVSEETRGALVEYASGGSDSSVESSGSEEETRLRISALLQLAASTPEFQRA